MHTPIKTWLGVTVIIIMALSAGMFIWYQQKNLAVDSQTTIIKPGAKQKECTAEAKLCPDGSAVGRTGSNCEFAPCSGEKTADVKCAQTSDCRLVYTGSSCSPCDYGSEEYKCVSPAQAKIIQDTWIQRSGGVQCEMCLSEERNFNFECTCNSGICEKTEKIDFSSWQTYRNEKYGFEINYPNGWNIKTDNTSTEFWHDQSNYGGVSMTLDNFNGSGLIEWYRSYYLNAVAAAKSANEPINLPSPEAFKQTTFNNYPAIEANNQFAFDHGITSIYFLKDKNIFNVSYPDSNVNDPNFNNNYQTFKKIFSTFKFTN